MECLSQSTIKARKSHKCSACLRRIDPGEIYTKFVMVDSGDFWEWKECEHCNAFIAHQDYSDIENVDGGYNKDSIEAGIWDYISEDPNTTIYDLRQCVYYLRGWRNRVSNELYPVPYAKEVE